ncbi:hypothetical protein SAMN05421759_103206 [Roseivivax lentus]|uniref:Uncharacterized protein n=1 Tax=Roseivivax lentus TaxID=633194 RepID=A0A1N7LW40_9RHOB|nr:hypothetical protein SAMN05421759_103206 [Roseivivax lentus]
MTRESRQDARRDDPGHAHVVTRTDATRRIGRAL